MCVSVYIIIIIKSLFFKKNLKNEQKDRFKSMICKFPIKHFKK